MRKPPPEILAALTAAAEQTRVPVTLLAAIAYQESSFDPNAVGQITKDFGLMQLSRAVMTDYQLQETEVFDARLNAVVGARHFASLVKTIGGDWSDAIAAYNLGLTKWRKYRSLKRRLPTTVRAYVAAVTANRRWLQEQSQPVGASSFEKLANAIAALAKLNPTVVEIVRERELFQTFYASTAGKVINAIALLDLAPLSAHWREYARLYDVAPLTDETTPPPAAIEPMLWDELLRRSAVQQHLPTGDPVSSAAPQGTAITRPPSDALAIPAAEEGEPKSNVGALCLLALAIYLAFAPR